MRIGRGRGRRAPGRSDRLGLEDRFGWSSPQRGAGASARVRIAIGRAAARQVQPFDGPGRSAGGPVRGIQEA